MKEMGVIDIIIEIVYYDYFQNFHEKFYVSKFFEILHNLLRISIMEYRPNELYASQWLDFIRQIALERNQDVGLNLALTELIDNNEKILTTRITSKMIESFVEKLKQQETIYLNLLKVILISDGKAINKNQMILNEILFNN